jgi:hypothetical protein
MILSMRTAFFILPTLAAVSIGSLFYPGQLIYFLLFSVTFFAVLYSAFFLPFQYSHLFLAIPWFLGFWLKLVVHFVLAYFGLMEAARYVEPAGKFDCAAGAWDQVLIIASVGGLGYILGRLLLAPLIMKSNELTSIKPPPWYRALRMPLWALVAIAFVAVIYANAETGLIVRGYVPRIQLPWPFGALFAWTTDIGFALVLSVLAVWDRGIGAGPVRGFFALCIEGAIISIQTNSRGIYLFHTLPALVSEARRPIAARSAIGKAGLFLGIWFAGAIAIPLLTTGLRAFGENVVLARTAQDEATAPVLSAPAAAAPPAATRGEATAICSAEPKAFVLPINPTHFEILRSFVIYAVQGASRLIIDRWPGMEGLMATQSYPERRLDLLKMAAFQRRTYGMVDIYTQTIAGSDFTEEKAKKYHNATLAGPIAFFYYSGSRLVVFAGMALLAMLVSILELIWASLVPDPLVTAMSGCYLALVVMQLSTGIFQAGSGPLAVTILLALVWIISRVGINTAKLLPDHA